MDAYLIAIETLRARLAYVNDLLRTFEEAARVVRERDREKELGWTKKT